MQGLLRRFFRKTNAKRRAFFLLSDVFFICLSMYLAFCLRFDWRIPDPYLKNLGVLLLLAVAVKLPVLYAHRLYNISWRFVSLSELFGVFKGVCLGSLALTAVLFVLRTYPVFSAFPRSVLVVDYFLTLFAIGGLRSAKRIYLYAFNGPYPGDKRRILVIGAGSAGEEIVRDMLRSNNSGYFPVGFVDDDPAKRGMAIHGVKVYGAREQMPELVQRLGVEGVVIAMPSVPSKQIRDMVRRVREAGVKDIKILPSLGDIISGHVYLNDIREVQVEDLLGREPARIDTEEIERYISGKVVLVTGAGGSIGSELSRQIARFNPRRLIMLDQDETALFYIDGRLRERRLGFEVVSVMADIRDRGKMERVFSGFMPDVVFHAAAYKHVPVLERHPDEAVRNNIVGTKVVAEVSRRVGVDKFVLISTDKAVNPTSIMGATKRVTEIMVQALNKGGATRFVAVRFGNVLESRGSVVPIFKEQIRRGGPVTVTHPQMKRYFMTIAEAVLLVLQAGAMGAGGEVFVLDMGEPVKIMDLAEELIKLSGLEPDKDVPIVFTGIRPGEKLFEEVLTAEEGTLATRHQKIFVAKTNPHITDGRLLGHINELERLAEVDDGQGIVEVLKKLVPTYRANGQALFERGKPLYERLELEEHKQLVG